MLALSVILLLIVAFGAFSLATVGFGAFERRYASIGLVAHLVGTVGLTLYYRDGEGDIHTYLMLGSNIARFLRHDFAFYFWDLAKLIFHQDNDFPLQVLLEGSSTGSMSGISGIVCFLVGDEPYLVNFFVSIFAFFGQAMLYRALRPSIVVEERKEAFFALLFVPSAVFWTSGMLKETILVGWFGILAWATALTFRQRSVMGACLVVIAGIGVGLIKSYLLFPFVVGVSAWLYVARGGERISFGYKVLAVGFALVGLFLMTKLFPEYGVDRLGEAMQTQRDAAIQAEGGSNVELGIGAERSLAGQIVFAPLALINTLFRPFIFEVRNGGQLLAGLETTAILLIIGQLAFTGRGMAALREVRRSPMLFASMCFVLSFGIGVGLATTNLGTLSRYRVPMMPSYALLLLILRKRFAPKKGEIARPAIRRFSSTDGVVEAPHPPSRARGMSEGGLRRRL